MKVKTAIKKMEKLNPEADLRMGNYEGNPVLFIESRLNDDGVVWLESESDIDLGNELKTRFEIASEEQMDELDFYMELVEIGITIEMIRKYMGDEVAVHMKQFCEEHALI